MLIPYWASSDKRVQLYLGDCVDIMSRMLADSVDSIVTDPPYGLAFMGKKWDNIKDQKEFHRQWAKQALRVLKPGGHILSMGGTRTYHHMTSALEDVGFEIRDCLMWVYGSGFPKSQNISKAIDKKLKVEQEVVGYYKTDDMRGDNYNHGHREYTTMDYAVTKATSEKAKEWDGWGTALKPAYEPAVLARKPLKEKGVADNIMKHSTGAINIEASRIPLAAYASAVVTDAVEGRWPTNVILECICETVIDIVHTNSDCPAYILDKQSGESKSTQSVLTSKPGQIYGGGDGLPSITGLYGYDDRGGASRFFFTAKAGSGERRGSSHPTIKPISLMKYLVRLITPPNGIILDPFAGSGSTLEAAYILGFQAVGIEMEESNIETISKRHQQLAMQLF